MADEKAEPATDPVIKIGNIELTTPKTQKRRLSMVLWGSAGCGKTTLAATAPGPILWINFDADGTVGLGDRDDIFLLDLSTQPDNIVEKFKEADPMRISKFLDEHPEIQSVVFDSVTSFGEKAIVHGVVKAAMTPKGKGATLEDPGFAGYGNKNLWTLMMTKNLLRLTAKYNKHFVLVAHENTPDKDQNGNVVSITLMVGSSLAEQVPIQLSEVWAMTDTGKERRIAVRPVRARKPMKSRMFITSGKPEFVWKYDADTGVGDTLAGWIEAWYKNDGKKLPLPN